MGKNPKIDEILSRLESGEYSDSDLCMAAAASIDHMIDDAGAGIARESEANGAHESMAYLVSVYLRHYAAGPGSAIAALVRLHVSPDKCVKVMVTAWALLSVRFAECFAKEGLEVEAAHDMADLYSTHVKGMCGVVLQGQTAEEAGKALGLTPTKH
jgi:hypothetical protein